MSEIPEQVPVVEVVRRALWVIAIALTGTFLIWAALEREILTNQFLG